MTRQAAAGEARMFPIAVDYSRFSGAQQEYGDSKRRQKSLADRWSERAGIPIDLRLGDDGVSGWANKQRRENADQYALAHFLQLVEQGRVQAGDYLLLENLDRLSREEMVPATHLLLSILMKGVRVVQLAPDELVFDQKSDMLAIFRAVMELSRGHGESERKHQVVTASYANNRAAAARGEESYQGYLPAWLTRDGPPGRGARRRLIVLVEGRARVVRQIFRWAAEGWGYTRIVRRLCAEGVEPFGGRVPRVDPETGEQARTRAGRLRWVKSGDKLGAGRWTRVYIVGMLRSRAAMGELVTKTGEVVPVPAAVTEEEWLAAQAARADRDRHRGRSRKAGPENIFQGLLTDAERGESFFAVTRQGRGRQWRVLINSGGKSNETAGTSFPEPVFEEAVLRCLREVDPAELAGPSGPDRLSVLAGRLGEVRGQLAALREELTSCARAPKGMALVMAALEAEEGRLEEERRQAQQEAAHPLSEAFGEAQALLGLVATAEQRVRLRSLLRRVVEEIRLLVVPRGWDRVAAVQMRFKGSEAVRSYLIIYRKDVMPDGRKASRRKRERGEDSWAVRSLRHQTPLDLRRPEHVAALREQLAALDLAAASGGSDLPS